MAVEWMDAGKPSVLGSISGCVAGLVAITPALRLSSKPFPAIMIGIAGRDRLLLHGHTALRRCSVTTTRLDAFGVHGAGGSLGAILTGVFATNAVNDGLKDAAGKPLPLGLADGNGGQILNQLGRLRHRHRARRRRHLDHSHRSSMPSSAFASPKSRKATAWYLSQHNEEGYVLEN
jgi:Amt family ammonium transporter